MIEAKGRAETRTFCPNYLTLSAAFVLAFAHPVAGSAAGRPVMRSCSRSPGGLGCSMLGLRDLVLPLCALLLAACTSAPPRDRWERPEDRSAPSARDTDDCSAAASQAEARYPVQPPEEAMRAPDPGSGVRLPAMIDAYNNCMRRKGFVRVAPPAR